MTKLTLKKVTRNAKGIAGAATVEIDGVELEVILLTGGIVLASDWDRIALGNVPGVRIVGRAMVAGPRLDPELLAELRLEVDRG
jgi:hypothetical protein